MNLRSLNHTFFAGAAAVSVGLALAATTTTSLQAATAPRSAGSPIAASAQNAPNQTTTTLTPVTPKSSIDPASSVEDIRDIRQPRHLTTPIPWAAAMAGVFILAVAGYLAWRWLRHSRLLRMTPRDIALQKLLQARGLMDPDHAREYCFAMSEIIRNYVEAQFQLRAPRLTTEEFLRDLMEAPQQMLSTHRPLLGAFLEHCDLAKFAGWRYSMPDLEEMHGSALNFVQQTDLDSVTAAHNPADPAAATR